MNTTTIINNSPVRTIKAKVESFDGSTLVDTYSYDDSLMSIDIARIGEESKFFGFGVCQRLNVKIRDIERAIDITTKNSFKVYFDSSAQDKRGYVSNYPIFNVSETHRDENTNGLSVTAYDALYKAETHTVAELGLTSYTVMEFVQACANVLGVAGVSIIGVSDEETCFDTYYLEGANFDGTENLRVALNAVAEATQTIYYLDVNNVLVFKRLDIEGDPVLTIGKDDYITLDSKTNRRLTKVCHATELGDNVEGTLKQTSYGELITFDGVFPGEYEIETTVTSKNIFDINKSRLGDLTNVSAWADVVFDIYQVKKMFKPNTTYTAHFTAKRLDESIHGVVFDAKLGFALHDPHNNVTVEICTINKGANGKILDYNEVVEASHTFTTPANLYDDAAYFTVMLYTQRSFSEAGGALEIGKIEFSNIQIEEGEKATEYEPCVSDLNTVTVVRYGKNLAPTLSKEVTNNGVIFTPAENGGITVSGTPNDIAVCTLATMKPIATTGKITVSLTGEFYNIVPDFKILNKNGTILAQIQTGKVTVVDLDAYPEAETWIVAIKREANNVAVNGTVYLQIELGDKATAYEPYNATLYTAKEDGALDGITPLVPITTLYSTTNGAYITAKCYLDNTLSGTTQYIRNNPFWDLREDIADLVDNALLAVYKLTINQFDCAWRGNHLLDIGDKIALVTKDNEEVYSYIIHDGIFYNGSLAETTSWNYNNTETETASNPSTLGDYLKQTSAKVDKVNQEIELLVSANNENSKAIASIRLDTKGITSMVGRLEEETQEGFENLNTITSDLSTQIQQTAKEVQISIDEIKTNGLDSVTTSTGFTFNEEGLTVSKGGSEMTTQITEDGMTVFKNNNAVLTANNTGVDAVNLRATTYLIIGTNSRFEDYGSKRTGCFWIG